MPFMSICEAVERFEKSEDEIMFIHIREPEEIKKVVDKFSCKTLLIKRDGTQKIISNDSDKNVENYSYDYVINNTTLENFKNMVKKLKQNNIDVNNLSIEEANNLKEFSGLRKVVDTIIDNEIAEKGKQINSELLSEEGNYYMLNGGINMNSLGSNIVSASVSTSTNGIFSLGENSRIKCSSGFHSNLDISIV